MNGRFLDGLIPALVVLFIVGGLVGGCTVRVCDYAIARVDVRWEEPQR